MSDNVKAGAYDGSHSLLPGYRFEVRMGEQVFGFQKVSGIKLSAAFEPLEVGGRNDGPVMLRAPVKDSGKLTLERGKYYSGQKLKLRPGQLLGKTMTIELKNDFGDAVLTYKVDTPSLESVELSGLDASSSSPLIEKLTVAHRGISEG